MRMNCERDRRLQQGAGAAAGLLSVLGVYVGSANELGVCRLPAFLLALAISWGLLAVYRGALLRRDAAPGSGGVWLSRSGLLLVIIWLYCGAARFWFAVLEGGLPWWLMALLPLPLLPLAARVGTRAVLRAAPLLCLLLLIAAVFDTLFVASRMDISLLQPICEPLAPAVWWPGALRLLLTLLAPAAALIYVFRGRAGDSCCRARLWGMGAAALYLLWQLLRDLLLFGDLIALDRYPLLRTLRSVDSGVGVSRLEFLGLICLTLVCLLGIMLLFAALFASPGKERCGKQPWPPIAAALITVFCAALAMGQNSGPRMEMLLPAAGLILLVAGGLWKGGREKRKN